MEGAQSMMNNRRPNAILSWLALALFILSAGSAVTAQNKKKGCGHPPKVLFQPKFSEEDRAKWKGKSPSGRFAIVVSEQGEVTQARVISASPKGAAEAMLSVTKQIKFEPRPGCGDLQTEIFFSFAE
jgi:hypothetical protein